MRLVFLHGFTGTPAAFEPVRAALEARLGVRVQLDAPALVGHAGATPEVSEASFEAEGARLLRLLRRSGSGPMHVVGYSLGARIALSLLLSAPEQFLSGFLIGVHPGLAEEAERAARRLADERLCELLDRSGLSSFIDAWERLPLWESQNTLPIAVMQRQRSARLTHSAEGLALSLRRTGLGQMPYYRARLSEVQCPVRLVTGELDEKFSHLAEQIVDELPCADYKAVRGAGHNVLLEQPERCAELLAEHLLAAQHRLALSARAQSGGLG